MYLRKGPPNSPLYGLRVGVTMLRSASPRTLHIPFGATMVLTWTLLSIFIASVASGGMAARVPLLGVPMAVVLLSQMFIPAARPRLDHSLSPRNFLLALFFIQLLVIPLFIITVGLAPGVLIRLPSDASLSEAAIIQTIAYLSCVTGLAVTGRARRDSLSPLDTDRELTSTSRPPPAILLVAVALAVGTIGAFLRFGSLSNLVGYFSGTSSVVYGLSNPSVGQTTVSESISVILLPFLGVAFVLAGCRMIDRVSPRGGRSRAVVLWGITIAGVTAAYGLFSYNRASFVMPLLAIAATYSVRRRRLPVALIAAGGVFLVVAVSAVGSFRTAYFSQSAGLSDSASAGADLNQTLQVYGQGPQFLGYLLENTPPDVVPMGPQPLVASALSPLPVLGRDYRSASSTELYNLLVRGQFITGDQIVPFAGELFWSFFLYGVVAGYLILGLVVAWIDGISRSARGALATFTASYAGFWTAFLVIGSISILSQVAIYFLPPLVLALFADHLLSKPRWRTRQ